MKVAHRMAGLTPSPTLAVMQEAKRLRAQGVDIIDFGPGEPDFITPEIVRQAAVQAIADGHTKYTAAAGIEELRRGIAERYNRDFGADFGPENVIVTGGAKQAIYSILTVLLEEGDEAVIPSPYWVTFPEAVKLTGARPVIVKTRQDEGFTLRVGDLEPLCNDKTRCLILNSPNNPSGALIPADELSRIYDFCRRRNIFVLSDETYDRFTYEGREHASLASLASKEDDGFGICGSFSKTYAMTGWRVGYLIAQADVVRLVNSLQSHLTGNVCSISQKAAVAALQAPPSTVEDMLSEYARRRRRVLRGLNEIPGIECPIPYGAFYAFPNIERCLAETGMADSVEFSRYLLTQARIAVVAGSSFGAEGYIRLSYATSMSNIEEGLQRLKAAVENLVAAS